LIDGGNSYFRDSDKRNKWARDNGLNWVSMGVSGGAEGALMGPSMMPSSDMNDFDSILEKLQKVAAKDASGLPCCIRVGGKSSGHFVKMVHNGIEYAEMQLIAEVYDLLRNALQMPPEEIADLFTLWNDGQCKSYLLEITKDILRSKDSSGLLLDEIVDVAKGKGTGTWTAITAAELGVPMPMVTAALNERFLSNSIDIRSEVSKSIKWDDPNPVDLELLEEAYHCARLVNHIQGFELIRMASEINNWGVNLSELARIWTNGCIIRSELMRELSITLKKEACLLRSLPTLEILNQNKNALIKLVQGFAISKVAMPAFSSALNYLKSIARADSAMNLIQAQRDYFGAHTYQKKGMEGIFTSDWNALR
ncbi:MAG: NADP-dependent phosphogluconate dehydrogenase, partial [Bacteroidia bacterium]|nr:NADP-dependent phosphogluconate dehydrogenase [Bacteroidia bacterium]